MSQLAQPCIQQEMLRAAACRRLEQQFEPDVQLVGPPPRFLPASLAYAWTLLLSGTPEEIARAGRIVEVVLSAQEMRPDLPEYGHFRFLFDDPVIADLNGVQMVLIDLLPVVLAYHTALPASLHAPVRQSIAAALMALAAIAVDMTYSNVALLDVANRILSGEYLGDARAVAAGIERLDAFIAYTNQHGSIRDFNSPTYLGQMISTLATLANHTGDGLVRRKAEVLQERLWLQAAVHYHPGLAQFSGPYSRAYPPDVRGETGLMKGLLYTFLGDERLLGAGRTLDDLDGYLLYHMAAHQFYLPAHLLDIAVRKQIPYDTRESVDREAGIGLTSHLGRTHTLGTADTGHGSQARNLLVRAASRRGSAPKVLFSRFLAQGEERDLNTTDPSLTEWGVFAGIQHGAWAIGLYGTRLDYRRIEALRLELVVLGAEEEDSLWQGERRVQAGQRLAAGQWLTLDLGTTYVALYPLEPTYLGGDRERPVLFQREGDRLRLEIDNYRGPAKHFWAYSPLPWERPDATPPFFHGNLHAGVVIETADGADFPDFASFRAHVARASVEDSMDEAIRCVSVARDRHRLLLEVDLLRFTTVARLVDERQLPCIPLVSSDAVQLVYLSERLAGASVRASAPGPWIVRTADGYSTTNPTPDEIAVEVGDMRIALPGFGTATLDAQGQITATS